MLRKSEWGMENATIPMNGALKPSNYFFENLI